jgi:hypothetical protein
MCVKKYFSTPKVEEMIDLVREDVSLCTKINMVKYRIFISTLLLLLATPYCHAHGYTLDDANHIIENNRASITADPALKR